MIQIDDKQFPTSKSFLLLHFDKRKGLVIDKLLQIFNVYRCVASKEAFQASAELTASFSTGWHLKMSTVVAFAPIGVKRFAIQKMGRP